MSHELKYDCAVLLMQHCVSEFDTFVAVVVVVVAMVVVMLLRLVMMKCCCDDSCYGYDRCD